MGKDIYESYEVREGGRWVERKFRPPYDGDRMTEEEAASFSHPVQLGRNYALFAILADVRNGVGFAGVPTGTGYRPISPLRELLEHDWGQRTTHFGEVDAVEYARFRREGRPGSWSAAVFDPEAVHISPAEMDALLRRGPQLAELSWDKPSLRHRAAGDGRVYVTSVRWEETYAEAVAPFVEETLAFLRAQVQGPDDLRMVFWFSG